MGIINVIVRLLLFFTAIIAVAEVFGQSISCISIIVILVLTIKIII